MTITESKIIEGLQVISPEVFRDQRGEFFETFNTREYSFADENGEKIEFLEDDVSVSKRSVLRGLHGDSNTWKLVQCLVGQLFYVVVDMRENSKTYKKVETIELNETNRNQLLIPAGCANGHLVLSEKAVLSYKQSQFYSGQKNQYTVRWNDPSLQIDWPVEAPILSDRDNNAPSL